MMTSHLVNPRLVSGIGALSLLIAGLGAPSAEASPQTASPSAASDSSTPAENSSSTPNQCTYRSVNVNDAKKTQGLPGQYTSGYSKKQNKLYVASAESGAAESTKSAPSLG